MALMQGADEQPLLSHDDVVNTMREHHQTILDQIESKNVAAMRELQDKSIEVDHLKSKVDEDLLQVPYPPA